MPRRPATLTQADVARAVRAAKQAGAEGVEIRPDGTMIIHIAKQPQRPEAAASPWTAQQDDLAQDEEIVL